ncbi:hypothetical protein C8Q78DRAFT_1076207 [Trametes maxima]|nr:hypothetical protein C8Q78DRAFT_1076207 [Trametes maxima]
MDADTMNRKILDLTDDELVALGYWGDQAIPHVKDAVQAVKNGPQRLGWMTCFMIECVKEQHEVPARRQNPAPQPPVPPSSPTFPASPTFSDPEIVYSRMSTESDAHTVVAPHLITKFERQFYYHGISGNPPELLYRSDLENNAFYVPTPGAPFSKIPIKIPNGVFGTDLNPIWDITVAPQIIASMKTHGIKYSALKTVRFTIIQHDQATIGPVVVWIAVKPNTTNTSALRNFTPEILRILFDSQITGVNTADDGQGTITLLFKEVETCEGEPSDRVLAVTNKHVACVDTKTDYRYDGTNPLPMLVCSDRRYDRAVTDIKAAVSVGVHQATKIFGEIGELEAKIGTPEEDRWSLKRLNTELEEIEEDNAIRQTLFVKVKTEWKNPDDRKFDYRHYTLDVATIDVDLTKLVHFTSNIVDLGNQFDATELEDLFWPVDVQGKGGTIPAGLQLPIPRALPRRLVINPDSEDKNGEPLYIVTKYGSASNLTLGRYAGMDEYTCDEFDVESREVVVYNYTKAEGRKTSGDFSDHGDSGSLIFTGGGDALAILHSPWSPQPRHLWNSDLVDH